MADTPTTMAVLANDAPNVWIARQLYTLAEKRLQLGKFAKPFTLPQSMGKTLRVVRYKRLALPVTTLTEGTPPDAVALSIENVDVTIEQWGLVVLLTDLAQITASHPALQLAIERTSIAMAETLEREMAETLLSGTGVVYGGAQSARASLTASHKLDTSTILLATTTLRNAGAGDWEGGLYGGVIPPQMESDVIASDSVFRQVSEFANVRRFDYGEIGVYGGVRWVRGNFLPIFKGVAAPDGTAATAEKAQAAVVNGGGSLAQGSYKVKVVARDILTDYERKISVDSGNLTTDAGNDDRITVTCPSSTNYVYDIYMTQVGGSTMYKMSSRVAASSANTYSTQPAGTEAQPPANPASGIEVFFGFVFGKDAFGRVELNGQSLQSFITPPGASWSNPLAQGRKVGSKIAWKCFVLDNAFFTRIECGSGFSAGLPA